MRESRRERGAERERAVCGFDGKGTMGTLSGVSSGSSFGYTPVSATVYEKEGVRTYLDLCFFKMTCRKIHFSSFHQIRCVFCSSEISLLLPRLISQPS